MSSKKIKKPNRKQIAAAKSDILVFREIAAKISALEAHSRMRGTESEYGKKLGHEMRGIAYRLHYLQHDAAIVAGLNVPERAAIPDLRIPNPLSRPPRT